MATNEIEQVGDVFRMEDGTEYRAVIERMEEAVDAPYDDGQWPILKAEYTYSNGYVAEAFNKAAEPFVDAFNRLARRRGQGYMDADFQRYLRIFHGTVRPDGKYGEAYRNYGPNPFTDYHYIAFAPRAWREENGIDLEQLEKEKPLSEIEAWCEGDVWGRRIEVRSSAVADLDDEDDWTPDEDGTCWGIYGKEWAEQSAKEDLQAAVDHHKPAEPDPYPEHSKIKPHQGAINAILEFLETHALADIHPRTEFNDPHIATVPDSKHQQVVFEHFGIDYSKIQHERELMLKSLREANESEQPKA